MVAQQCDILYTICMSLKNKDLVRGVWIVTKKEKAKVLRLAKKNTVSSSAIIRSLIKNVKE